MFCKSQKCKQNIYGGGPDRSENSVFPPPEHDWNVHKTSKNMKMAALSTKLNNQMKWFVLFLSTFNFHV